MKLKAIKSRKSAGIFSRLSTKVKKKVTYFVLGRYEGMFTLSSVTRILKLL